MTKTVKLFGILIVVALAATGCNYVHRNFSGRADHAGMHRHARAMEFRHMRGMGYRHMNRGDQFMFRGPGEMNGNRWRDMHGMGRVMGPADGMRRGRVAMEAGQMGRNYMGAGRIPGLTDSQRKEIADLRQQQLQEMDKLREETFAKMQTLREENRAKMMSLLTDDQKKFLESGPSDGRKGRAPVTK